uniref:Putative ephrin receptor n=1 Tax=Schistosoma mansoni TaxID=6183 RepID=A0A5K4EL66_SCHMA
MIRCSNFTSKSVFLDGCFNCKLKIQFNSVVCSNKQYPTIDNNKINDGFFQPLLLNNEFTNDYLHSTIRKDTKRLDKYDIHQSFRMNPSYNNNNVQQSFSCMNNDNLYEMYQIIITKVTLLNEHTKGIDNKIENLNQSSTSILLTTNCYLSNIYSFSQLIIELIMAQLMLENKHKFIDIIQLFNKNHNGHCYQNMNLLDRNSVSTWNLNSSSADKFSSSNTSYLYPTSIVHNLLQSPQPPLQQENLDTSEDNYKDMKHSLISSDRTIECQTLPTMKQLSNPSCHSLTNSPNLNTTLPMIIHM